jgi:hypothetical protein
MLRPGIGTRNRIIKLMDADKQVDTDKPAIVIETDNEGWHWCPVEKVPYRGRKARMLFEKMCWLNPKLSQLLTGHVNWIALEGACASVLFHFNELLETALKHYHTVWLGDPEVFVHHDKDQVLVQVMGGIAASKTFMTEAALNKWVEAHDGGLAHLKMPNSQ